jgi:hypothetical protein
VIGGEQFRFDPSDHSYYLGDRRLIGVSEAIQAAGLKDFSRIDPTVLERAQQRGTAVHLACHYLDDGDLDWSTVSPEIEPYVRAWERFKADTGLIINETEHPRYHATLGFAGTPDRLVTLGGHNGTLDLKTYKPDDAVGIQLGAYSYLGYGPQPSFNAPKRWGLWLKDDGKYKMTEFTDRGDEAVFMAALTIAKFKGASK